MGNVPVNEDQIEQQGRSLEQKQTPPVTEAQLSSPTHVEDPHHHHHHHHHHQGNTERPAESERAHSLRVSKLLGSGSFSRVYKVSIFPPPPTVLAESPFPTCALKAIPKSLLVEADDWPNLLLERDVLALNCSPYITKFYASFSDPLNHYLLMELVDGSSLWSLLRALQDRQAAAGSPAPPPPSSSSVPLPSFSAVPLPSSSAEQPISSLLETEPHPLPLPVPTPPSPLPSEVDNDPNTATQPSDQPTETTVPLDPVSLPSPKPIDVEEVSTPINDESNSSPSSSSSSSSTSSDLPGHEPTTANEIENKETPFDPNSSLDAISAETTEVSEDGHETSQSERAAQGLEEEILRYLARQICLAVDALHRRGYLCRDIKPENILITSDHQVRLSDFGLALRLPFVPDLGQIFPDVKDNTQVGRDENHIDTEQVFSPSSAERQEQPIVKAFSGTLAYLSPEMLRSAEGEHSLEHDWWAVGIVLFLSATLQHPFLVPLANKKELYQAITSAETQPAFDLLAHLTAEGQDFIRGLLDKKPEQRFGSKQIFRHPWILGAPREAPASLTSIDVSSLSDTTHIAWTETLRPGETELTEKSLPFPFDTLPRTAEDNVLALACSLPDPLPGRLMPSSFPQAPEPPAQHILAELEKARETIKELTFLVNHQKKTIQARDLTIKQQQNTIKQLQDTIDGFLGRTVS